jgi:hypothetical protein
MNLPSYIKNSTLYTRLCDDSELLAVTLSLRSVVSSLAETVSRTVPEFTDHSIRHMDSLWRIVDCILTPSEVASMSIGEAFLLACSFYLHDIGMAYAATKDGLDRILSSPQFSSVIEAIPPQLRGDNKYRVRALAYAVRVLHAEVASELATEPIPGTNIFLFEALSIRETWAETCGKVATSHNWNLERVERDLGSQGRIPLPGGHNGDLGYVASILRLADYAHINRDRALIFDRAFRQPIEKGSLTHWFAQENIDGPERDGADLVYRAAKPISDVDAWWLYYEMVKGLDDEIRKVRRYLDRRTSSQGRLSLQGVRGVTSPDEAAVFIPTDGFLPIEINLRTGSIERLVKLLAGESLYGPDPMAAVRELIQNARDAVMLKSAIATTEYEKASLSIPIRIALKTKEPHPMLEIIDSGVGMTQKVMTDYLTSIASNYWESQYFKDFPTALGRGFQPVGKFGIGFLSVFMLGENVNVISNRENGERYHLYLRGVGRRGDIRTGQFQSGSGTTVQVELHQSVVDSLQPFNELVCVYAPMVAHAFEIDIDGEITTIAEGWLQHLNVTDFYQWTLQALSIISRNRSDRERIIYRQNLLPLRFLDEKMWPKVCPEYQTKNIRLLASGEGTSLLCSGGLAIQPIRTPGFIGVIDIDSLTLDVSRREAINTDVTKILMQAKIAIKPQIIENLNKFKDEGLLIDKLEFLRQCVKLYGRDTILEASIPWISLLKLPGEIQLLSCSALLERLAKSKSLFAAYGTGPWTAMRRWVGLSSQPSADELAVVLDDSHVSYLGYQSTDNEKIGSLVMLWPECDKDPLFGTILQLVAEAWQIDLDRSLIKMDGTIVVRLYGVVCQGNNLFCYLIPKLISVG